MTDPIDEAIRATSPPEVVWPENMAEIPLLLTGTRRPVLLTVPSDLSLGERAELAHYVLGALGTYLARQSATPSIVVARGVVDR